MIFYHVTSVQNWERIREQGALIARRTIPFHHDLPFDSPLKFQPAIYGLPALDTPQWLFNPIEPNIYNALFRYILRAHAGRDRALQILAVEPPQENTVLVRDWLYEGHATPLQRAPCEHSARFEHRVEQHRTGWMHSTLVPFAQKERWENFMFPEVLCFGTVRLPSIKPHIRIEHGQIDAFIQNMRSMARADNAGSVMRVPMADAMRGFVKYRGPWMRP